MRGETKEKKQEKTDTDKKGGGGEGAGIRQEDKVLCMQAFTYLGNLAALPWQHSAEIPPVPRVSHNRKCDCHHKLSAGKVT